MSEPHEYAVSLRVAGAWVPWPHPVWWRFWDKVPRRMGFTVEFLVLAASAEDATRDARVRLEHELARKVTNAPGDPYRLEVLSTRLVTADAPVTDSGFKRWFADPDPHAPPDAPGFH